MESANDGTGGGSAGPAETSGLAVRLTIVLEGWNEERESGAHARGRRPLPALALAGGLVIGAVIAGWDGGLDGLALGAGIAAVTTGARGVWRGPGRRPWVLGCLLVLVGASAVRAAEGSVDNDGPRQPALAHAARRPTRDPGRTMLEIGPRASIDCARGTAVPGDVVLVLDGVTARRRAVGCLPAAGDSEEDAREENGEAAREEGTRSGRPVLTRPRPLAPRLLADDLVRLAAGPRAGRPGPLGALRRDGLRAAAGHPSPRTAGLLAALLFGETGHLEPGMADLFTRTGTRHMLALSGLHVGLIGVMVAIPLGSLLAGVINLALGAAFALGGRPRPGGISPGLVAALLAIAFIPLAGYGAPAARAAVALALGWVAPKGSRGRPGSHRRDGEGRRPVGLNLLGVALAIECVIDPLAPLRTGVQLSYGATAALIAVGPAAAAQAWDRVARILRLEDGRIAPVDRHGRPRWALGRAVLERAMRGTVAGVAASMVATLATLPVVWSTFGECAPVGIVATPLLLPLLGLMIAAGFAFVALPDRSAPQGWAADIAERAGEAMVDVLAFIDCAPWTPLPLPPRGAAAVAVVSLMGLVCLGSGGRLPRPWGRAAGCGFAVGLALLLGRSTVAGPTGLEVLVADVGNGTGILIRAPDSPTVVFDGGSRDRVGVATNAMGPMLRALGGGTVDVCLTHDHADHAGGLPWIARRFGVRRWIGPRPTLREAPGLGPAPWGRAEIITPGPGLTRLDPMGSALELRALRGGAFPGNEGSLVLDVRWEGARVVLSGDAEGHGLGAMLRGLPGIAPPMDPGPVDALLLPHHGSSSKHLGWLLDHLGPREVWVSATEVAPALAAECDRRGIRLRATALGGPFTWTAHNPLVTGDPGPNR